MRYCEHSRRTYGFALALATLVFLPSGGYCGTQGHGISHVAPVSTSLGSVHAADARRLTTFGGDTFSALSHLVVLGDNHLEVARFLEDLPAQHQGARYVDDKIIVGMTGLVINSADGRSGIQTAFEDENHALATMLGLMFKRVSLSFDLANTHESLKGFNVPYNASDPRYYARLRGYVGRMFDGQGAGLADESSVVAAEREALTNPRTVTLGPADDTMQILSDVLARPRGSLVGVGLKVFVQNPFKRPALGTPEAKKLQDLFRPLVAVINHNCEDKAIFEQAILTIVKLYGWHAGIAKLLMENVEKNSPAFAYVRQLIDKQPFDR